MNDILSTVLKVGLSTLASLVGWVVATKVLSLELGAAGVGLFGLLRQLLQNLNSPSVFSQAALVQGIAGTDGNEQQRYTGVVFRLLSLLSIMLGIVIFSAAPWLGPRLIPHPQASALLRWLAFALLAIAAQTFFTGVLNGHRMVNALVKSQILGPLSVIASLYPMLLLLRHGQPVGFVIMLAVPAVISACAAAIYAHKGGHLTELLSRGFPKEVVQHFFQMSGVLFITGVLTTGAVYFQNWAVAKHLGLEQSGYFWTAWTLSMTYVTLILSSYGTYYMPSLARLEAPEDRRALIRNYLRLSLLALPVLVSIVVVLKPLVIRMMFSASLLPALKVMRWMLIGDLFKGVSWVMSFPMLAFRNMKWFFWSDLLLFPGLALSSWVWIARGGSIEGLGILFLVFYILYFIAMVYFIFHMHGFVWERGEGIRFVIALVMVTGLSWAVWNDQQVHAGAVAALIAACGTYVLLPLPGHLKTWLGKKGN